MLRWSQTQLRNALQSGQVVRGETYEVGGRKLTPIARVRSKEDAGGRLFRGSVHPIAIVEEVGGARRLLTLGGRWGLEISLLALASLPVIVYAVVWAALRSRQRSGPALSR